MQSFDAPWAAAALLLFVPFHLWLRHRRPLDHSVGGLQPFRQLATSGAAHSRRRPWSYWLFLLAILGTTFALMGPRGGGLPPLLLVDQSLSASLQAEPAPSGFHGETRTLGSKTEVITHREIFEALQHVAPGRDITVWTDLPAPSALPESVTWKDARVADQDLATEAILDAKAIDRGVWLVHWAKIGRGEGVLVTSMDSILPVTGVRGVKVVDNIGQGGVLSLNEIPSAGEAGISDFQRYFPRTLGVIVEENTHPDWLPAFQAIDPNLYFIPIVNEEFQDLQRPLPNLQMGGETYPQPEAWSAIPWTQAPTPEHIALLARTWPPLTGTHRDSREVLPILEAPAFPQATLASRNMQPGHPPSWMTLLVLLSGLCATAAWLLLPKPTYSSSAV
ncbi:MAG: hypothetical protein ACPG31_04645 [Planctomycetota bacterium]